MNAADTLREIASRLPKGKAHARAVERLHKWADMLDRAPTGRQPAIANAVMIVEPALAPALATWAGPLALALPAQYANMPHRIPTLARLVLGETPTALAPGLTAHEAHEWLIAGAPSLTGWLATRLGCPIIARSIAVTRWLGAAWADPPRRAALERQREARIAGQVVRGRYLDRVDELIPSDLPRGPASSVEETFARAGKRLAKALERSLQSKGEPLCAEPKWWRLTRARCARLIRTGPDLVAEGRAMRHCVATYATAVKTGKSVIIGLCVRGERSTVEVDPATCKVRQHKGRDNAEPPELCVRALRVLERRWTPREAGMSV